ncbi:hypothetical protein EES44_23025 [Streptomyces sp. ADI96-15]|nr:hypothetical protein EES44_23025 [Streptomyces sp. ADI96-15]
MGIFGRKNETTDTTVSPDLAALTGTYTLDPTHTTIGFVARHAMVTNVKGGFGDFTGTLTLDGSDPSNSTAEIDVAMDSVDTGNADRDGHLKNADFFKTDEFPKMTFRSTEAEALGGDDYRITGDLTILGTTRPLSIDLEFNGSATDPFGNERVGFEGTASILRSEWGLTWNAALETGGVLVSDKIKLVFDISAIKNACRGPAPRGTGAREPCRARPPSLPEGGRSCVRARLPHRAGRLRRLPGGALHPGPRPGADRAPPDGRCRNGHSVAAVNAPVTPPARPARSGDAEGGAGGAG